MATSFTIQEVRDTAKMVELIQMVKDEPKAVKSLIAGFAEAEETLSKAQEVSDKESRARNLLQQAEEKEKANARKAEELATREAEAIKLESTASDKDATVSSIRAEVEGLKADYSKKVRKVDQEIADARLAIDEAEKATKKVTGLENEIDRLKQVIKEKDDKLAAFKSLVG
jgi:chromosome segregation ATPase